MTGHGKAMNGSQTPAGARTHNPPPDRCSSLSAPHTNAHGHVLGHHTNQEKTND